jgi:SAM-dependent methyltransferase
VSADHERRNRAFWDADADDYQAVHGAQLASGKVWGVWAIPEADIGAVGDTRGLDVLDYGCGAAQWSIALTRDGARPVGLDQSRAQLRHAAANVAASGVSFPLLCASGEAVPLRDASFDLVLCDHGAMSFCDPDRSVPEVARLLRPDGRLVFNKSTILHYLCWDDAKDRQTRKLHHPYFDSRVFDSEEGTVDFQIPYGEWIRLFARFGLVVEDLIELRAPDDASTTYDDFAHDWATRWPAEEIWKVRKT